VHCPAAPNSLLQFTTKYPGKVLSILPSDIYAKTKASKTTKGLVEGQVAAKSYNQAASECKNAVEKIAKECRRVNHKYRDPHYDIEWDLKRRARDCLCSLEDNEGNSLDPKSVKRVTVSLLGQLGGKACVVSQYLTSHRISSKIHNSSKTDRQRAMFVRETTEIAGSSPHCAPFATSPG